jgi:hypothetical protein
MNAVFKKLNYKDHPVIHVLNAPDSFIPEITEIAKFTIVKTSLTRERGVKFFLAFVQKKIEVEALASKIALLAPDAVLWFAYPKKTSTKFTCDFNRDTGWQSLGNLGFEGVRMVAIDQDWSALRFKKPAFIKKMNRSFAISEEGKRKVEEAKRKKT